jgi:hypothetical protein
MLGVRREVFVAAAQPEEVEDGVAVALGSGARGEWTVGVVEGAPAEAVGDVDAGPGVFEGNAEEGGGVEFETAAGLGRAEEVGGGVVEDEGGFEVGAGDAVVDPGDFVP